MYENTTYSFCIAFTTALENGAEEVFALIMDVLLKLSANIQAPETQLVYQ